MSRKICLNTFCPRRSRASRRPGGIYPGDGGGPSPLRQPYGDFKRKHKKPFGGRQAEKEANRLAEKKAIEDARFVLPNACNTKMICTMNAPKPDELFHPAVLQPGPVGNPGCGGSDVSAGLRRGAKAIPERGAVLRKRGVLRGENACGKMREVRERFAAMREQCHGKG